MIHRPRFAAVLLAGLVSACAPAPECAPPSAPATLFSLYVGRSMPGGSEVDKAAWRAFLDGEVTPRFPDGFTVLKAQGAWRDGARGTTSFEASNVLEIVVMGAPAPARAKADEIAAAYKRRFQQQSVLVTESAVCAKF
ncbi:MAG: DUF3574 domain-containing protein [Alphaproteobacteria bacterium]|nr:DUF3574 domain-containing protein [Alphaproteobacteria bacterium]